MCARGCVCGGAEERVAFIAAEKAKANSVSEADRQFLQEAYTSGLRVCFYTGFQDSMTDRVRRPPVLPIVSPPPPPHPVLLPRIYASTSVCSFVVCVCGSRQQSRFNNIPIFEY
eukprot:GHVU01186947.1.p2 GENE.GHVU01186947.1~~GHVU01186947.1.p2  ORF type:complete len:114 (+),score=15.30 GHVU01186947.1:115-456(+)